MSFWPPRHRPSLRPWPRQTPSSRPILKKMILKPSPLCVRYECFSWYQICYNKWRRSLPCPGLLLQVVNLPSVFLCHLDQLRIFTPSDVYPPALSSLSLLSYRAVTRLGRILLSLRTKVLPENIHLNLNGRCETALMGTSHYAEIQKFTRGKSLNPFMASP